MVAFTRMKQRRGLASEWTSINPILTDGEIGYEKDTGFFKVGNGVGEWNVLPYSTSKPLLDHLNDTVDTHDASSISFVPVGSLSATDVQAAIQELDAEKSDTFVRNTTTYTTALLIAGAYETGSLPIAAGYRLYKLQTSAECRVRLYTTAALRDADIARLTGTNPPENSGLILEYIASGANTYILSPMVDGFVESGSGVSVTIDNTDSVSAAISITLTYLRTE